MIRQPACLLTVVAALLLAAPIASASVLDFTNVHTGGPVTAGDSDVIVGHVIATATGGDIDLTALTISGFGTGNEMFCAGTGGAVLLVHDADADGSYSAVIDATLDSGVYGEDDGTIAFDFDALPISDGNSVALFVLYHFSELAEDGGTFGVRVNDATVTGADSPTVSGLPADSVAMALTNPYTPSLILETDTPADAVVAPGTTMVPMLRVELRAVDASTYVSGFTLEPVGTALEDTDITSVALIIDHNRDGVITIGPDADEIVSSATFAADNADLTLPASLEAWVGLRIPLIVATSFSTGITVDGVMSGLRLTAIDATNNPTAAALPLQSATITIELPQGDAGGNGSTDYTLPATAPVGSAGCHAAAVGSAVLAGLALIVLLTLAVVRRRA